jgi:alginate O-acetyltransferase complex protein AlgI
MNFSNFTAPTFLFFFLPIVLAVYFASPKPLRNAVLLIASILFYAEGEKIYTLIMVFSIVFNYAMGMTIDFTRPPAPRKLLLTFAIAVNLSLLVTFKYAGFLVSNVNHVLALAHLSPLPPARLHLPIGISFFTFHALSYVTDVYRRQVRPMRRFDSFALYITLFPQLIAGPIIRYKIIADQFSNRRVTLEGFAEGVRRFVIGLGKKLIIADTVAYVADQIFSAKQTGLLVPSVAWLGVICYTIQIYFDFSGYSDMAIGMGRMFGFVFPENFNYPYTARSITDFWRRWHMTLSSWFRDYLYIPLGGNRVRPLRVYLNLLTVFLLCGLWHGATWSFVLWGLFHGTFLIFERIGLGEWLDRRTPILRHAYLLLVVMVGWVFFNARDLSTALTYLSVMFGLRHGSGLEYNLALYLDPALLLALTAGVLGSMPVVPLVRRAWERIVQQSPQAQALAWEAIGRMAGVAMLALIFFGSAMMAAHGSYSPFIYYRF